MRDPDAAGGAATGRDIGYHDDSFCCREGSPLAGVTLPRSLGGAGYAQLQRALDVGAENKWITAFIDTGLSPSTSSTYAVRAYDAAGNASAASAAVTVVTLPSSSGGPVLDDVDGDPASPSAARNDLGKWTGGNCFLNGSGSGAFSGGALSLRYGNCGWSGSDVNTDLSAYTHLAVRIKGAAGGEQRHFHLGLGGGPGPSPTSPSTAAAIRPSPRPTRTSGSRCPPTASTARRRGSSRWASGTAATAPSPSTPCRSADPCGEAGPPPRSPCARGPRTSRLI
ncbi:hypothetical protein [Nonomuraea sp. NPDC050783]|uniref:hypothetical protein n=1 Tax=Nonomuraea sp. NPDC050783 TaxID=3154634 RepID=UPI003467E94E